MRLPDHLSNPQQPRTCFPKKSDYFCFCQISQVSYPMKDHLSTKNNATQLQSSEEHGSSERLKAAPPFQLLAGDPPPVQAKASSGGMPTDLSAGFAATTGHDLSDVNVHYNSSKPAEVGALAYAHGNDIYLGTGQEQHLPHEAAHIIQQREGRVQANTAVHGMAVNNDKDLESEADRIGTEATQMKAGEASASSISNKADKSGRPAQLRGKDAPIQRLIKSSYPWQSVVANCSVATLRSAPRMEANNAIAWPTSGTRLTVNSESTGWLNVTVEINGRTQTGFIYHNLVDDAVAASLTSMVGQEATWVPSGAGSGNTFEAWASAATEAAAPALGAATTINCWEMVLLAAFRARVITWAWIHDLYVNRGMDTWVGRMASSTSPYVPGTSRPQRGDLVFWNGLDHVALATGNGEEIISFWPPPQMESVAGTVDKVKTTTITALTGYVTRTWGAPTVTFGAGTW
jgi:Domain of unknown function (DUF4157)